MKGCGTERGGGLTYKGGSSGEGKELSFTLFTQKLGCSTPTRFRGRGRGGDRISHEPYVGGESRRGEKTALICGASFALELPPVPFKGEIDGREDLKGSSEIRKGEKGKSGMTERHKSN